MGLSLDDVLSAPQDPELLNRHLQNLGLLPAPPTQPAESLVPMRPPTMPSGPPATVPLKPFTAPRPEHLPAMHSQEMPEAPSMMTPPIVASPDGASSPLVKPMTAPTLSEEQQKRLPETSPGMEGGSIPFYQQRLDEAIARNKRDSMSDHPSFLGKVGHVLGRVGNIALDTLAPGIGMNIPGTDMYKRAEESEAEKNLAGAKKEKSEEELLGAETEEARARARKLGEEGKENLILDPAGNIRGWHDEKGGLHSLEDPNTPKAIKEMAKDWESKASGKPESIDQAAVNAKMQETNPATGKPYTAYEARVELAADIAGNKSQGLTSAELDEKYDKIGTDLRLGRPVSAEDAAWAKTYEKRKTLAPFATVQAQAPVREESRGDKSYDRNNTAIDKMATPVEQLNARMARLNEALAQNSPTADALIGPELLSIMAGGQGTGLRMTDAEIGRIVHGRGHWDDLRGAIQLWALDPSKANSITPEQRREIRSLVSAVQQKMVAKNNAVGKAREAMLNNQEDPDQHRRIVEELHGTLNQIDSREAGGPPEGKTTVYDPQGAQHYVNSDKVEKFLNDPKYKGWSRNAPSK